MQRFLSRIGFCLPLLFALAVAGCESALLESSTGIDKSKIAGAGPSDVNALVEGGFSNWYYSVQGETPSLALSTMADGHTSSWSNFGMRYLSAVPRPAMSGASSDPAIEVIDQPWYLSYATLSSANIALLAVRGGLRIPKQSERQMLETAAVFLQGAALANVALLFDQGYVVTDATDVTAPVSLSDRVAVRDSALALLDEAIALGRVASFQLPDGYLNHTGWSNLQLVQVANTIAARTIAYFPRNSEEAANADWGRVLMYARAGISGEGGFDPSITGDNGQWYDPYKYYSQSYNGWMRVSMRVVCELDPTQPCAYPAAGWPPQPRSADRRFSTDYIYLPQIPFPAMRGRYYLSPVGQKRYRFHSFEDESGGGLGVMPFMLRSENDLLIAEALIRTNGSRSGAVELINRTRVGRGDLTPLSGNEPAEVLLNALFYERDVELLGSGAGIQFFDRRRTDRLPAGTPAQFPVPAVERKAGITAVYSLSDEPSAIGIGLAGSESAASLATQGRVQQTAEAIKAANRKVRGMVRE